MITQPFCHEQNVTGLNSEFSFKTDYFTKIKEPSLPYYFPITGGGIVGCILFARVSEMQIVPLRIWTQVSLSYFLQW